MILISPSKTLDFSLDVPSVRTTQPRLLGQTQILAETLKDQKRSELQKTLSISAKLAEQVYGYIADFRPPFNKSNAKPAAFVFKGDVYRAFDFSSYTKEQIQFLQSNLRIISGFYGFLRPLDLIQAYRLPMGTKLSNPKGKNLYEFWGNQITNLLNADIKKSSATYLLNLASDEYFSVIQPEALKVPLVKISFKEKKGQDYKVVGLFAKRARGLMADYIIRNNIKKLSDLKDFNSEGYKFNSLVSAQDELVFTRHGKK